MKKILVIAGNYKQFLDHAKGLNPEAISLSRLRALVSDKEYIFIDNPMHMKGFRGVEVEFWGTYWERKDILELTKEADHAKRLRV